MQWYECKVKFIKIDEGGYERKVTTNFLIDAVSYTDAESRIFQIMKELTNGDFRVANIKQSNITEIIGSEECPLWYKAKIRLSIIDEILGKEKKVNNYMLVMGNDIDHATKNLHEGLSYLLIPYELTSITLSSIFDVFPFSKEN